jgi:hypothetical protein
LSSRGRKLSVPRGFALDYRIQDRQQLAHAGRERYFFAFAAGEQTLIEIANHWIVAASD